MKTLRQLLLEEHEDHSHKNIDKDNHTKDHEKYAICPECGGDNAATWFIDLDMERGRCDDCGAKWNETEKQDAEFNKRAAETNKQQADEDKAEQLANDRLSKMRFDDE